MLRRGMGVLVVLSLGLLTLAGGVRAIYGGQDANFSEFPWMVSVQVHDGSDWAHVCGGTLVDPSWVLTAAHCVASDTSAMDGDDLRVVVGQEKQQGGTWPASARREVGDPVLYPAADGSPLYFKSDGHRADLALLKLDQPIYDTPRIALSYGEMPAGTALTAVGWGCTADYWFPFGCPESDLPAKLQKLDHVRVKPDSECWNTSKSAVAAKQICTKADRGIVTLGGPRKGDSGGPVLLRVEDRWIQLGIASHLPKACAPEVTKCGFFDFGTGGTSTSDGDPNYTGWVSVKHYRDWITSAVANAPAASISTALIVDSSGSMTSNDPQNRRLAGARSYVTASLPDDEVGVVDFDDSARVLSNAVHVGQNRQALLDAIGRIDSSGGTNLGAGLTSGCNLLTGATGQRRAAIFLTDGIGSYTNQSSCYSSRGWPVFTIGLGSGVDRTLLNRIASETGGSYLQLESSTNLVCEFQQIRSQIAGLGRGSCTPTGNIAMGQTVNLLVTVAHFLQQFTFTNTWLGSDIEMTVTAPSGRSYSRNSVVPELVTNHGPNFETFTITKPEPGEWNVKLFGADIPSGGEPFTFSTVGLPSEGDQLDTDGDGISDPDDNCAYVANTDQSNVDGDDLGDVCDDDAPGFTPVLGVIGGTVPATLALTVSTPASFGVFEPGVDRRYTASTTANVISTAGDATLSVLDPGPVAPGRLVNGAFTLSHPLRVAADNSPLGELGPIRAYASPVSNDVVQVTFTQDISATERLRTGSYSKTLVFQLTTTAP